MRAYILRRLVLMLPVLFGVSVIIFVIIRVIPGDIAELRLGDMGTKEQVDALRKQMGLDRPIVVQYATWIGGIFKGDMGQSMWTGRPVFQELVSRLEVSFELMLLAMVVSIAIAIPAGIIMAIHQDTPLDYVVRVSSILGLSIPNFWLGTLLITLPAIWFHWIPSPLYVPFLESPLENLKQFALPSVALGAALAAIVARMTRSSMLEIIREDYIRTARAKGLMERLVITRHALKNALIPVLTVIGNQIGHLLGGSLIIEILFNLPGLGRLTYNAILNRDYTQLQNNVLFVAAVFVLVNLLVDVIYVFLDPRIQYGASSR